MPNGLMLGSKSRSITRNELREIETPEPTRSWKPVPHAEVADLIIGHAQSLGYEIENEQYGVNPSGTKMFGVARFHPEGNPDYTRALGFRNSHDMSFAVGLTVGLRVIVCDNLMLAGEQTLLRRHTSGIDLEEVVPRAFASFEIRFQALEQHRVRLSEEVIDIDEARLTVVRAAEMDAIPSCDILAILSEYTKPRHEEFAGPTRWSLYNCFTELSKKYTPERAHKCRSRLAKLFELE